MQQRPALTLTVLACLALAMLAIHAPWSAPSPASVPDGTAAAGAPRSAEAQLTTSTPAAAAERSTEDGQATASKRTVADAAGPRTGSLLVNVVWSDGSPAEGVYVYVTSGERYAQLPAARVRTDAVGRAHAPELAPGPVQVSTDRGGATEASIVAGAQREVRLALEAGVVVHGTVKDGSGVPVGGAAIWLTSWQSAWMAGAVVAHAGDDGTFTLRGVPPQQSLGALAPGYAPSQFVDLELLDTKSSPVRVELVLASAGSGGALAGHVVDARGQPVAGAFVAVGAPHRVTDWHPNGAIVEAWAPRKATSSDDGSFTVLSLAPGKHPVEVWARSFPFWHGECEIQAGTTTTCEIRLLDGVTVHGVVRGEDGAPLAGAIVRAFPKAIDTKYLPMGGFDYDSTFGCPFATAGADGSYRLLRAAPGVLHLYAVAARDPRGDPAGPWASAVLEGQPGDVLEWNPRVEPGPTIRGVVRFRDGVPMPHHFVTLIEPGSGRGNPRQVVTTDAQGRFRFVRLERRAHDVSVQLQWLPKDAPPVGARDVWPNEGELELVASFDAPKKVVHAKVRGRVQDAGNRVPAGALRVILQTGRGWYHNCEIDDDAFVFADVEPQRVQVVVMSGEVPVHHGGWFELQPAEDKDVGTLVTEPAGRLRLRLERGPGTEQVTPTVSLRFGDGMHGPRVKPGTANEVLVENLSRGAYAISAYGEGIVTAKGEAHVTAGGESSAVLRLRAGALREVVVDYPATVELRRMRVQHEDGTVLYDAPPHQTDTRPHSRKLRLPLGRMTLAVELEGREPQQVEFEMKSLDADQPPVRLEVR